MEFFEKRNVRIHWWWLSLNSESIHKVDMISNKCIVSALYRITILCEFNHFSQYSNRIIPLSIIRIRNYISMRMFELHHKWNEVKKALLAKYPLVFGYFYLPILSSYFQQLKTFQSSVTKKRVIIINRWYEYAICAAYVAEQVVNGS